MVLVHFSASLFLKVKFLKLAIVSSRHQEDFRATIVHYQLSCLQQDVESVRYFCGLSLLVVSQNTSQNGSEQAPYESSEHQVMRVGEKMVTIFKPLGGTREKSKFQQFGAPPNNRTPELYLETKQLGLDTSSPEGSGQFCCG